MESSRRCRSTGPRRTSSLKTAPRRRWGAAGAGAPRGAASPSAPPPPPTARRCPPASAPALPGPATASGSKGSPFRITKPAKQGGKFRQCYILWVFLFARHAFNAGRLARTSPTSCLLNGRWLGRTEPNLIDFKRGSRVNRHSHILLLTADPWNTNLRTWWGPDQDLRYLVTHYSPKYLEWN